MYVVDQPERFVKCDAVQHGSVGCQGLKPLTGTRMGGNQHRVAPAVPDCGEAVEQPPQPSGIIDILLPVSAHHDIAAGGQVELVEDPRPLDLGPVVLQHLAHRRPGVQDPARMQTFGEEIASRVFGVNEVEVGDVVDQPTVSFLRHVEVEAAISGLHVVDRYAQPPCHQGGDTAVGVPQHQERIRPQVGDGRLDSDQHATQHPPQRGRVHPQETVRLAQPQFGEEDVGESFVPILSGVHQRVVHGVVEPADDPGQPDDLRPSPHHCHNACHLRPLRVFNLARMSSNWSTPTRSDIRS